MDVSFEILKKDVAEGVSIEEVASKIAEVNFEKEWKNEEISGWQIRDIVEHDEKYIIEVRLSQKQMKNKAVETLGNLKQEEVVQGIAPEECVKQTDEELRRLHNDVSTSNVFNGPLKDVNFNMDVGHMVAFFELVQFTQFLVANTGMISPSASRALVICQKFLVDKFTDYKEAVKEHGKENISEKNPLNVKLNDDFAKHVSEWQTETAELYKKMTTGKPQVVQATMLPDKNFDPRGPQHGGRGAF